MALPTSMTPSRPGQINSTGSATALNLKQFAGEVLTSFEENNVAQSRHIVRKIANGASAQFPAIGKTTASMHTPGLIIDGLAINHNERVLTIDGLLISPVFIANLDEAMSHYEFRGEYAKQAGASLARAFDQNVLINIGLAARGTATVTGGNGGSAITSANCKTVAADLEAAIFAAVQKLDEKDVPKNDRYVALTPAQYYLLAASSSKLVHADYVGTSNGGYAQGTVLRIAGCEIVKTNNLPITNIAANTLSPTAIGNFATTAALVWQKAAVGTVKLMDISVESDYYVDRQGSLLVAKMAVGHGILRPECAVEIKTA